MGYPGRRNLSPLCWKSRAVEDYYYSARSRSECVASHALPTTRFRFIQLRFSTVLFKRWECRKWWIGLWLGIWWMLFLLHLITAVTWTLKSNQLTSFCFLVPPYLIENKTRVYCSYIDCYWVIVWFYRVSCCGCVFWWIDDYCGMGWNIPVDWLGLMVSFCCGLFSFYLLQWIV